MARFRHRAGDPAPVAEQQLDLFTRVRQAVAPARNDASIPARRLFYCVLALMGLGLLLQASHASTTLPEAAFREHLIGQLTWRGVALLLMVGIWELGTGRLRPLAPAMAVVGLLSLAACYLVDPINGSHRWIRVLGVQVQPSEVARVFALVWLARRCSDLGPRMADPVRGFLPTIATGACFAGLILGETDLGATIILCVSWAAVMWVAGFQQRHIALSAAAVGSVVLVGSVFSLGYVRERLLMLKGDVVNHQMEAAFEAFRSGGWTGLGLGQGWARTQGLQYQQTDLVFSLVGEELGRLGALLVLFLWVTFLWNGLAVAVSLRSRFLACVALGMTVLLTVEALVHMSVGVDLAPPKGLAFPFLSEGKSSLLASALAVGLILGATSRKGLPMENQPAA